MKKLFFFFGLLLLPLSLPSQSVSVAETRLPQDISFATPFDADIVLSHEPGDTLSLNEDTPTDAFEILSHQVTAASPGTTTLHLRVMPFTLAASTFTVTLNVSHNGTEVAPYNVEIPVVVQPVELFKDKKFHEIRDPKVSISWLLWLLILAVIIAIFWAIGRLRKKTEDDGPAWQRFGPDTDNRPCHEIALSKIDALINSGLWERQEYKLFYTTLFDILREYLWRRFHLDTSAETSAELLRNAKKEKELNTSLQDLKDFLTSGDLVKFAKVVPSETERNRDIMYLQALIKRTTPPPPEKEEKEA